MRTNFRSTFFFLALLSTTLFSCLKNNVDSKNEQLSKEPPNFKTWADRYSIALSNQRLQTLNMVRNKANHPATQIRKLANGQKLSVIPLDHSFLNEMKISKYSSGYILAFQDSSEVIQRADVVLYSSETSENKTITEVADVFQQYFTSSKISLQGSLRFLTLDGKYKYEVGFANGEPQKWARATKRPAKNASSTGDIEKSLTCYAFYLVVTYYQDGVIVNQTETYLGTSCYGESNGDCPGDWEGFCTPGSGGGSGGGETLEENCCIPDPNIGVSSTNPTTNPSKSCAATYWDQYTQEWLGNCSLSWEYHPEKLWIWNWSWVSNETYVRKGASATGPYTFKSVSHLGNSLNGATPPCVSINSTITIWNYSFTSGNAKLNISITGKTTLNVDCCLTCGPQTMTYSASTNLVEP